MDGRSKAIIFDFDGTLVDSMNMWTDIDIEYLGRYGKTFSEDLQRDIEGMSTAEMCVYFRERYQIPQTNEEMINAWTEMSRHKYLYEIGLKAGVREFLEHCREKKIRMAIATSTELDIAIPCLKTHGIDGYFETVATTTEAGIGKPDPAVFLLAAKRLGLEPSECIAFEDLPAGIRAAKAAGMTVIAVDDSFSHDREEEKRELADRYIKDFFELLSDRDFLEA